MKDQNKPQLTGSKIIAAAVGAWFIFLSIDFLIHAVILATWWKKTADYWLSPEELFRMIPIGYASFAIYCGALTWLFVRILGDRRTIGTALRKSTGKAHYFSGGMKGGKATEIEHLCMVQLFY